MAQKRIQDFAAVTPADATDVLVSQAGTTGRVTATNLVAATSALSNASINNRNRANHTGTDPIQVINITANYILQATDIGLVSNADCWILADSTVPITVTWPANATIPSRTGVVVRLVQLGTGSVTLVGASGVLVRSPGTPTTRAINSLIECTKILTDTIIVTLDQVAGGGPVLVTPPVISGTGITGDTLTCTPGTYNPTGTITRQWRRVNLTTLAITNVGTNSTTYVPVVGDEGFGVDCVETNTDTLGLVATGISNRINITPAAAKPVNTALPQVFNGSSTNVGGTVNLFIGSWTNSPTGYKVQRQRNGVNDGALVNQASPAFTYTIQAGDAGTGLTWTVTAYNGAGDAVVPATTANPYPIAINTPLVFTTNPQITSPNSIAGVTLTVGDGVTNVTATRTRAWGFTDPSGPFTGNISPPQTGTTYVTNTSDIGSQIWCDVTATNASGFVTTRALGPTIVAATPPPPPPPPPPPSGNVPGIRPGPALTNRSTNLVATSGQVISRIRFNGAIATHITIPQNVVGVLIEDCEFLNNTNAAIDNNGTNTTVRFCYIHDCFRGILNDSGSSNMSITYCDFFNISNVNPFEGSMVTTIFTNGPTNISYNSFRGNCNSDIVSNFSTSRITMTYNTWDVNITEPSSTPWTIGDSLNQPPTPLIPGRDNYIAFNTIRYTGVGVPAGCFGSDGNTIIEYNCFAQGIQLREYPPVNENGPSPFLGVIVRFNVINIGNSFIPQVGLGNVAQWSTNIDSTNCALVPTP